MDCDVGEVKERLQNELCYDYNNELCSFSNLSVHFTYVTAHSPTNPLLHLRHSSFSNSSFASSTSQALHLRHLASRPWHTQITIMNSRIVSIVSVDVDGWPVCFIPVSSVLLKLFIWRVNSVRTRESDIISLYSRGCYCQFILFRSTCNDATTSHFHLTRLYFFINFHRTHFHHL